MPPTPISPSDSRDIVSDFIKCYLHFLLEGSSSYGRPPSLLDYNPLPYVPVTQSSTLTYQTSHPQGELETKNLTWFGGVKTLLYVFIVCRSVTVWLSTMQYSIFINNFPQGVFQN